jgi:hypothetical protein
MVGGVEITQSDQGDMEAKFRLAKVEATASQLGCKCNPIEFHIRKFLAHPASGRTCGALVGYVKGTWGSPGLQPCD